MLFTEALNTATVITSLLWKRPSKLVAYLSICAAIHSSLQNKLFQSKVLTHGRHYVRHWW